jgi:hypothetical protein
VVIKRSGDAHVRRTKNCAVPVGHEQIIALVQAVGACLYWVVSIYVSSEDGLLVACSYQLRGLSRPSPALPEGGSYAGPLHSWLLRYVVVDWVLVQVAIERRQETL